MKSIRLVGGATAIALVAAALTAAVVLATANLIAKGGAVTHVYIASSDFNSTTSSTTYTDLPGMALTFSVPATSPAQLIDIRFSAESACYGGGASPNWCTVQILVDGVPAQPVDACGGTRDFAFDSTDTGNNTPGSWSGKAMERFAVVQPGTHKVKVQGAVTDFGVTGTQIFWTGERILAVDEAKSTSLTGTNACGAAGPASQGH